ncbi:MAG TPA: YicC/YloC family endoribonuclease [Aliidongia sp.]|uniref:YicC/YloC family endoribonuclease n=1 Tax=Aliidongia sp. TaxID=1914230 RepID=UPI002DDD99A8|nr:YicC/YloC family endoribonuclease [Aliidongia sp.]HEV2678633.1 YicC/YloC family endoribonuclease [Aliidongia sp.]
MAVSSMTGFARVEGQIDGFAWVWELKSVNGKALDLRFRLPAGYDAIEAPCKVLLGDRIKRGSINVTLTITEAARAAQLKINETVLNQVIGLLNSLEGVIDAAPPRLDGLLAIRGVMELVDDQPGPEAREARLAALTESFGRAAAALVASRDGEGERIGRVLGTRLDEIAGYVSAAERSAAAQPDAIRVRFKQQIADLLDGAPPVTEDRLAQELAVILARADVREELDRLTAHVQGARELLLEGLGVGRRFDFLCQEFNREANTVCSKSADLGLTRTGLDLKAAIEQLREQVQNIE